MERKDDADAYVRAKWASLVRSAVFLGCSQTEAEDLVQTTLLRCYKAWDKVVAAQDRDAYIYRVLVNCFRKSRARRWTKEVPTELPGIETASLDNTAEQVTSNYLLRHVLLKLPEDQRKVLVLRYYADLSERQVSEVLGIPTGTVKSRASRALGKILGDLKDPTRVPSRTGVHDE